VLRVLVEREALPGDQVEERTRSFDLLARTRDHDRQRSGSGGLRATEHWSGDESLPT
jgi:hypothetical protein